jgi:integrase/recombinase XerD
MRYACPPTVCCQVLRAKRGPNAFTAGHATVRDVKLAHKVSSQERLVLAGFLAGYTGLTREACALVLRQYATWCH